MRHIINLIGPTAVGKSTVIQALNEQLPHYEVLAIDDFRRRIGTFTPEGESQAWREVWIAALKADCSIIESSGTSPHLSMLLDRLWRAPGTNILTIALEAPPKVCLKRAQQRIEAGYVPPPLSFVPEKKWIPLSEVSNGLRFTATGLSPTQLAEAIFAQLPVDFR
jgi:predicted kinase